MDIDQVSLKYMPVRSIPRNTRSITGRLASYDHQGSYEHESLLERDCLVLLSFDPDVVSIETQPVRIAYERPDKNWRLCLRHYVPDILVHYRAEAEQPPLLIEVKYEEQLWSKKYKLLPKIQAGIRYAHARNWRFKVYTERRIRGTKLRNIHYLRPFLREARDPFFAELLLDTLARLGPCPASELLRVCGDRKGDPAAVILPHMWRLLAAHEVLVDLDTAPLSLATCLAHRGPSETRIAIL